MAVVPKDSDWLQGGAYLDLGIVQGAQGNYKQAEYYTQEARKIYEHLNDQFHLVNVWINLGMINDFTGNWSGATSNYEQALKTAERLGSVTHQARLNLNLGILYMNEGIDGDAQICFNKAISFSRSMDLLELEINALIGQAQLHIRRKESEQASLLLTDAQEKAISKHAQDQLAEIYRNQAESFFLEGNIRKAHSLIKKALSISQKINYSLEEGICFRILAQVEDKLNLPSCLQSYQKSLLLLDKMDPYEASKTKLAFGLALLSDLDKSKALLLINEARSTFLGLGAKRELAFIDNMSI